MKLGNSGSSCNELNYIPVTPRGNKYFWILQTLQWCKVERHFWVRFLCFLSLGPEAENNGEGNKKDVEKDLGREIIRLDVQSSSDWKKWAKSKEPYKEEGIELFIKLVRKISEPITCRTSQNLTNVHQLYLGPMNYKYTYRTVLFCK